MATLHADLIRKGPALLLRDLERGKDKQVAALRMLVKTIQPDILFLTKVDFDLEHRTGSALKEALGFKHMFTRAPNSMTPTALDLDGDGRAGDRQAWVRYAGEGGMLLLSQHPVELAYHLNDLLWKDAPNAAMPVNEHGAPFPSAEAQGVQKLVSQGLWIVTVTPEILPPLTLVLFHNQTPAFDGPEDLNGLRNSAQLGLLSAVMDEDYGTFPKDRFILMGNANLDPNDGDGERAAISALLADKRLQDAKPVSESGDHVTANWEKYGSMRVSYVLPSTDWSIAQAGVVWPNDGPLRAAAEQASRHRMVWVDVTPPQ